MLIKFEAFLSGVRLLTTHKYGVDPSITPIAKVANKTTLHNED